MKRFIVLIAIVAFSYCGYQLVGLPSYGTSFWQAINRQMLLHNEFVIWHLAGFAVAALVLVIAAFEKGRTFTQEQRLDHIWKFIREQTPFVERMEGKHAEAARLKGDLTQLQGRIVGLIDSSAGLPALVRQVEVLHGDFKRSLGEFTRRDDGSDLLETMGDLAGSFDATRTRFQALENHIAGLPAMKAEIDGMVARAGALGDEKDGIVAQLTALCKRIDGLTDDDGNGTLDEIERGDPEDHHNNLEEQVGNLSNELDDIKIRFKALEEVLSKFGQVREGFAAFGNEPPPTNIVAGPGATAAR